MVLVSSASDVLFRRCDFWSQQRWCQQFLWQQRLVAVTVLVSVVISFCSSVKSRRQVLSQQHLWWYHLAMVLVLVSVLLSLRQGLVLVAPCLVLATSLEAASRHGDGIGLGSNIFCGRVLPRPLLFASVAVTLLASTATSTVAAFFVLETWQCLVAVTALVSMVVSSVACFVLAATLCLGDVFSSSILGSDLLSRRCLRREHLIVLTALVSAVMSSAAATRLGINPLAWHWCQRRRRLLRQCPFDDVAASRRGNSVGVDGGVVCGVRCLGLDLMSR